MTFRFALFIAMPCIPLFVLAHAYGLQWLIWMAVMGLMIAAIVFAFDQME